MVLDETNKRSIILRLFSALPCPLLYVKAGWSDGFVASSSVFSGFSIQNKTKDAKKCI